MAGLGDFLSGVIAAIFHLFITPYITAFLPQFGIITFYGYNALFLGIWVVVATLILEKIGHK